MKKTNLIRRFYYRLDEIMSKGTISIIRILSFAVFSAVIFISILIVLFKLRNSFFSAFWDSLATIVNAWMPSSDDGEFGYIVLNTITAIIGLFFTSILIGVISSGIEEKIDKLRKGNSIVLEKNHTVILGYNYGEHGLLNQLILAAGNKKKVIVILSDLEKPDLEEDILNSVSVPKNVKVICRNGDITSISDLRICSIETSDHIIINALNDNRRIKAILAISSLKREFPECHAGIVACVSSNRYLLPQRKIDNKNVIMLKTDDIMAQIIAHTATEPGLSMVFKELMNFEKNELYFEKEYRFIGKTVLEINRTLENASLIGIKRGDDIILNPDRDLIADVTDELILFEMEKGSYVVASDDIKNVEDRISPLIQKEGKGRITVFGNNSLLNMILKELHDDVENIMIISEDEEVLSYADRYPKLQIAIQKTYTENDLKRIAEQSDHIVILADRDIDREDADIDSILLLLKLQDIKERNDYQYNFVVELNLENSYNVALKNDQIDYIVSSDISSLILAQISENPDLRDVFRELLSNKGNELYSRSIRMFNLGDKHDYSYRGLKEITLSYGYTLLGYIHEGKTVMNAKLKDRVEFSLNDRLIVLGRH